jgi:hypothetical protein
VSLSKEVCWCDGRSSLFALRLEIFFILSDHFRYSSVTLALSNSNFSGSASRAFCRQSHQTWVWQWSVVRASKSIEKQHDGAVVPTHQGSCVL